MPSPSPKAQSVSIAHLTELVSHYLFKDRFGRPGKGNDKGKVEGLVKHARANFMTPIPIAPSYEAFNATLRERCLARQSERLDRRLLVWSGG